MSRCTVEKFGLADRLINDGGTAVTDALLGLIGANPDVGMLDFGKVIVRRDYETMETVKIVSGGASGHEPAHAGFVGKGMLTATVQGDIFNSPPASEVLRTIKEINFKNNSGTLIIIGNNTGDRLNFGLAMERARNSGIRVKMLVVGEDCNVTDPLKGRRGLSGMVFMHKIAGAMAEEGHSLDEIFDFCRKTHQEMSTVLLTLKPCTSPNVQNCICGKQLLPTEYEIGGGLRGEGGGHRIKKTIPRELVKILINELTDRFLPHRLELNSQTPVAVLFNNLGAASKLEELTVTREFTHRLYKLGIPVLRIYQNRWMTSLDSSGFTITVLKLVDSKLLLFLDAPCNVPTWGRPNMKDCHPGLEQTLPTNAKDPVMDETLRGPKLSGREANILQLVVQFGCDALISCEKQLNLIDAELGDGDTGSVLKRGAEAINFEITNKSLNPLYPFVYFEGMSRIVEKAMAGTLGCIYSIFFEAGAKAFGDLPEKTIVDVRLWLAALRAANKALKTYTSVEYGCATMFDPLHIFEKVLEENLNNEKTYIEALAMAVSAAEDTADKTKQLTRKYPDPGAHAVGIWLRAVYEGIKLRCNY